jgi:ATP-binding cassette subfamily B protein
MRDRLRLLAGLRAAGAGPVTVLAVLRLLDKLVPAATALATALLVSRVTGIGRAGVPAAALLPLAVFAVVLLIGHAVEAALDPLSFLIQQRIDGAHRADVARLTATSPTIGALEQPEAQRLVRLARADPVTWSERTPGQGALAQVEQLASVLGVLASCLVLLHFAWWLVPLLLLPALLLASVRHRQELGFNVSWQSGQQENMQAERWQDAIASPGAGKDLRVFGIGDWTVRRIVRHHVVRSEPNWAVTRRMFLAEWKQLLLVGLPLLVAFTAVVTMTVHGHRSVAAETAVLAAGAGLYSALRYDDRTRDRMGGLAMLHALDRLKLLLREEPQDPVRPVELPDGPGPVRFERVGFRYPGTDRTVLEGLDLEIRPGELLAIVGLNGAGKSTLIKLLAGLYRPTAGRITVDGTDIAELAAGAWRERIAVVFQDFVKYELSAADNVSLGRPGVPRDPALLEAAARDAGLDPVLDRLPQRWDTPLARSRTGGVDLSGGQWQQIVLTRALYAVRAGARLLVLDEPTAHLDVRTEFDVFRRLAEQRGESSVVLISHRLSTVRRADRIVLLDGGRITEAGSHDELLDLGGDYAELFRIQAERFQQGYQDSIEEGELL